MKPGLNTYKKAYKKCEEGLKIKQHATSAELLNWLIENYNLYSLNITPKGITYYLKTQGYPKKRKYDTKPYVFYYKE
jgi:hypothetical protein